MNLTTYRLDPQVAVSDMAAASTFYEDKLGLPVVRTGADGSKVYAAGRDVLLNVDPSPDSAGTSAATLASWTVDDVEQAVDELTAKGVAFEHYEGELESGFDFGTDDKGISPRAGGGKIGWFKDPDGNIFAIEGDR